MKAEEEIYRGNTSYSEAHLPLFLFLKYLKRGSVFFWTVRAKQKSNYYCVYVMDDTLTVFEVGICILGLFREMKEKDSQRSTSGQEAYLRPCDKTLQAL